MYYVFSTLTADNIYAQYRDTGNGIVEVDQKVFIKGGHGIANKHFVTPKGVVTNIEDEDYDLLKNNPVFQLHVKKGFIKVEKKAADVEEVADDMEVKDKSAPLTDDDFKDVQDNPEAAKPSNTKKKAA